MKTIRKFPLEVVPERQVIRMPMRAKILHVGQQDGEPFVWVEVETLRAYEARWFRVVGTGGGVVPTRVQYVGSVCCNPKSGPDIVGVTAFVWHVYEETVT